MRCVHESALHERNSFVTLTYAPDQVPVDGSLQVRDWQLFAKRVRKAKGPFRFFHCGEYGELNGRPHYHACVFGLDFAEDRVPFKGKPGSELFVSRELEDLWGHGFATVGRLTFESAAYVARYVMKKATGKRVEGEITPYSRFDSRTGEVYQVRPEYVTMSRRPGIGAGWFARFKGDVFPDDFVVHAGKRYRAPRFYDALLERESPELLASLKAKRRDVAFRRREDSTPERLRVRERVAIARLGLVPRDSV